MDALTAFAQTNTAARLRAAAAHGSLSHALIFSGPGDRRAAALYAAAAMECAAADGRPCLACPACRKVMQEIHPDVQFVRDEDHAEIAIDIVRAVRTDAFIRPNEGTRKVYIFEDCTVLNEKDQNVLLKVVEEGPPYAAFLFCSENPNALLQTIRSRCVEVRTTLLSEAEPEDNGQALEFCRLIAGKDVPAISAFLIRMENDKCKREELAAFLESCRSLLSDALKTQYGLAVSAEAQSFASLVYKNLTKPQILGTIELLQTYRSDCIYNVGVGPTLGGLAVELEELL